MSALRGATLPRRLASLALLVAASSVTTWSGPATAGPREEAAAVRRGFTMTVATHLVRQDIGASGRGFDPAAEAIDVSTEFGFGAFLDPHWSVSCVLFDATGESSRLADEFPLTGLRSIDSRQSTVMFAVENWSLAPLSLSAAVGLSVFVTNWLITLDGEEVLGLDSGVAFEVGASYGLYRWGRHRVELRAVLGRAAYDDMGVTYARCGVGYRLF